MAKKRPALARVLGARSVAAVAYGEIGSSLFIALGIVAFLAGGLLPWVLLGVGAIFFLVSLSYAEGMARRSRRPAAGRCSCAARSTTRPGSSRAGCCSSTTSS